MTKKLILNLAHKDYGSQVVVDGVMFNYNRKTHNYVAAHFQETYKAMGYPDIGDGSDPAYYKHGGNPTGIAFFAKQHELFGESHLPRGEG